jgi:hypothetical protein
MNRSRVNAAGEYRPMLPLGRSGEANSPRRW